MTTADEALSRRIGDRVRALRNLVKPSLTQEQLAEKAELTPNYIGNVERAEKMVSVATCKRIANALDMKLSEFLAEIGE